ncbi:MAG: AAA family ATPase, partial [bacterium]|nr:AAA family ATPase [bacterium]
MNKENFKKIPYGISDFNLFRQDNLYYVDKTPFLQEIENAGRYLFFIRPRRFGKSLFLSMMKSYYDVFYEKEFRDIFKNTWVLDNPTPEKNKYLVLSLNFSEVSPNRQHLENSFLNLIRDNARDFATKYSQFLSPAADMEEYRHFINTSASAPDILGHLTRLVKNAGQKMMVIIDEYDNFANTILTASGDSAYHALTHGDGFMRTFFNFLKAGTGDFNAPIARLFITGVSPITMDDVTSGFNIGQNVSLSSRLDTMLGFTQEEVETMCGYYKQFCPILQTTPQLMDLLTLWYGNYNFSGTSKTPLFNPDMILYFLNYCLRENRLPENMIDRNVRIDYGKLRHLIIIDRGESTTPATNGNFSKLKQIIADNGTLSKISDGFPLKEMTDTNNFKSLLFYFGLLTIAGRERNRYRLIIPNETVKRLYYDYIDNAYKETGVFSIDLSTYGDLISDMAYDGAWRPLLEYITERMKKSLALRDLITGEKAVQTFLN